VKITHIPAIASSHFKLCWNFAKEKNVLKKRCKMIGGSD
jgi:hypothetical protein